MAAAAYALVYDVWSDGVTVDGSIFAVKRVAGEGVGGEDLFYLRITRAATLGSRVIWEGEITQTIWEDISGASADADDV